METSLELDVIDIRIKSHYAEIRNLEIRRMELQKRYKAETPLAGNTTQPTQQEEHA